MIRGREVWIKREEGRADNEGMEKTAEKERGNWRLMIWEWWRAKERERGRRTRDNE